MRVLDFADGFTSASAPTVGSSSVVTGSTGSPVLITAVGGVTPQGVANEVIFIAGNGGPIDVTANPQIAAGSSIGQYLYLIGTHDTNTVKLEDLTGLRLNGDYFLVNGSVLEVIWDGSAWSEVSRNDI